MRISVVESCRKSLPLREYNAVSLSHLGDLLGLNFASLSEHPVLPQIFFHLVKSGQCRFAFLSHSEEMYSLLRFDRSVPFVVRKRKCFLCELLPQRPPQLAFDLSRMMRANSV